MTGPGTTHRGRVYSVPGYTHDDLRQEAALAALGAPGFEGLAVNLRLVDLLRSATKGRQAALNTATVLEEFQHPGRTDDAVLEARDLVRRLRDLPLGERRVVVLFAAGFSYAEIAAREGLGTKAVDNRLQQARRRLAA